MPFFGGEDSGRISVGTGAGIVCTIEDMRSYTVSNRIPVPVYIPSLYHGTSVKKGELQVYL